MKDALEKLIKALVKEPEAVEVDAIERDSRTTVLVLRVAGGDMGKVIGRHGRTVRAIRTLLHATSIKHNHRYQLEIEE